MYDTPGKKIVNLFEVMKYDQWNDSYGNVLQWKINILCII